MRRSTVGPTTSRRTPTGRWSVEANAFAAELLMPEPAVRAEWPRAASAAELARWFGVSEEAMSWRLYNFGLSDARP